MTHEDKIEEIMDWFQFEKCRKAMVALDWSWSTDDARSESIPEVAELRKEARRLLRLVAGKPE